MGADKPSRGLVLFGAGIARFVNQSHTHLHSLAAQSLCGFLSLPHFPPSISTSTVFVHVGAHEESSISKGTEYINALVGEIISIAKPKSQIGSRLHLSVVLSYGDTSKDDESNFLISNKNKIIQSGFVSLYPRQSYTMKGSNPRTNVRGYWPILLAQWQDAVTRKDMVETFSFQDFMENGGNLTISADRFLHEVAFKLWKAPKYGA